MKNHRLTTKPRRRIPPPPGLEAGYDAIIAYHKKYSLEELEKAGHTEEVPAEVSRELAASATYQLLCRQGLNVKLSREDYERLSILAAEEDILAEEMVKKWIRQRLAAEEKVGNKPRR